VREKVYPAKEKAKNNSHNPTNSGDGFFIRRTKRDGN
jgi:hypothetical protein